jgi:hypothetical protein
LSPAAPPALKLWADAPPWWWRRRRRSDNARIFRIKTESKQSPFVP